MIMTVNKFRVFLLIAACAPFANALAGVGATSSGVSTNIGTGSTDPSAGVQQQSAGFTQQNQQLQNASAPGAAASLAMPGSATGANPSKSNAAGNSPGSTDPAQAAGAAPGAAAAPAVPPPPPPTYVSVVKHLKPDAPPADTVATGVVAVPTTTPPPAQVDATPAAPARAPAMTPAVPTAAPRPVARADANVANHTGAEHMPDASGSTGGRGDAPDGITFYAGLGLALALLAFALSTYLRAQRDETVRRPSVR
jgi:hypothetical protein